MGDIPKRERICYMGESDLEDDPFQSSGEEWDFEKAKREEHGRGRGRGTSLRLGRRPRKLFDSDGNDTEKKSRRRNGSTKKRKLKKERKNSVISTGSESLGESETTPISTPVKQEKIDDDVVILEPDEPTIQPNAVQSMEGNVSFPKLSVRPVNNTYSRPISRKYIPKTIYSEEYATGTFVISKKDAQWGDPKKQPCIWRIDGKALLQKYEAFEEDGKVRHRNTSVYTGWSPLDKDIYSPVTVDVIKHVNSNLIVELHWEKLQTISIDSD